MSSPVSGPRPRPLVGNLPEFARDPLGFLTSCAREYGDIVAIRLGQWPGRLINHPDLAEEVFITHNRSFVKHRFFWRHVEAMFGHGLLTSEGDFWLRQRRLAQPAFHRDRIAAYARMMIELAEKTGDGWQAGQTRDIHHEMMELTLRIVVRTLFAVDAPKDVAEFGGAVDLAIKEIAARFRRPFRIPDAVPTPGNLRYRRALRHIDGFVHRIIAERRQDRSDRGDLLSMLLAVRDEDGTSMTDQQVRDEAVTLFLAGHETTAIALTWVWMLLSQHPEADAKLAEELDIVLGRRPPTPADVPRLVYTQAIVQEGLRLYPPAWVIGREAVAPCAIGDHHIAVGMTIFVSPWVIHRDPRYYERPDEFRPERWLDDARSKLPRFAYLPFGAGPRLCIGNAFAMTEATLILATLAQRFRPTLRDTKPIAPFPSITLRPASPVWMNLNLRSAIGRSADRDEVSRSAGL
jgi:cytochrome P450